MKSRLPRILVWSSIALPIVVWSCMHARSWLRARSVSRVGVCQEHLTMIDGAKQQWALENNVTDLHVAPTARDLLPEDGSCYLTMFPPLPQGGYAIGSLGSDPTCDSGLPGHSLSGFPMPTPMPR